MSARETYYVVLNNEGRALRLFRYEAGDSPGGVLVLGDEGHLFRHRYTAKRAIERTRRYAAENGMAWPVDRLRIERLVIYAAGGADR